MSVDGHIAFERTAPAAAVAPVPPGPVSLTRWQLEEIVDLVVDRIEQRVVDELERRGRRHTPGVF